MKAFSISGPVIIKRKQEQAFKPFPSLTPLERYKDIRLLIATAIKKKSTFTSLHMIPALTVGFWRDKSYIIILITIVMMQIM